jgi:hypothetical protein
MIQIYNMSRNFMDITGNYPDEWTIYVNLRHGL